jgi:CheY-like chemotaxis protein
VEARTRDLVFTEAVLLRSEKMAAIGQLSAGVAHEINNPAAAVAANMAYLRDDVAKGTLPPDALECLDESLEAVDRIARIVRQLLDSGRAAATVVIEDGASASALRATQKAILVARPSVPAHVDISIDIAAGIFVHGQEASIVQVLVNLIVNGAQAVPKERDSGRVVIRARKEADFVTLDVTDDGSGMTEDTKRRLFEPFFTTKPFGQGTGLGLPVSLGLVRSMGGDLLVTSGPTGTTMSVVLPTSESAPASVPQVPASPPRGRTMLLVDDDPAVGRAIARSLGSMFDVELVTDVGGALAKLYERSYDVVLSDMQMPGGGGRLLYERIAAHSPDAARRMIMFSGGTPSEADSSFFETHGVALLEKPLSVDQLLRASNRICGESAPLAR